MNTLPTRTDAPQRRETTPLSGQPTGLVALPGDRKVWWTGRVAIGLRHNMPHDELVYRRNAS